MSVYEGVVLEDYVFCGPSCVFTNDLTPRSKYPKGPSGYKPTLVRKGATIGANATIVCGNTIGRWALVAAGAVVTKVARLRRRRGRGAGKADGLGLRVRRGFGGACLRACGGRYKITVGNYVARRRRLTPRRGEKGRSPWNFAI